MLEKQPVGCCFSGHAVCHSSPGNTVPYSRAGGRLHSTLVAIQGSSQKSIKKHLLHSVGSSCWGFYCVLSSTNPGNANATCASFEHTVVNLS